ncbi:YkyA family protein [Bacillus chungangensis]|uniref:Rubrerythrin n=1 Tax=Bacillus chungangensis TaxID=587633 RepID=A0ABT9WV63_9BACI|nr:YkyA family protein [Bacillus chungangensis]MDQ0177004.1 rubrerythrin [Bacillus chungangensis]
MRKAAKSIFIMMMASLLSGCFHMTSPEETIYTIFEKTVEKEKDFKELQQPLVELEKKESAIYDQIMELGMKEFTKIKKLADDALLNVDERENMMVKEQEAMNASQEEFEKAKEYIDKIKEKELKKAANDLYILMKKRYQAHEILFDIYKEGLEADRQLYRLFKDEELEYDVLEGQIEVTNTHYAKLLEANNQFNEATEEFNEKKLVFYQQAGIQVEAQ